MYMPFIPSLHSIPIRAVPPTNHKPMGGQQAWLVSGLLPIRNASHLAPLSQLFDSAIVIGCWWLWFYHLADPIKTTLLLAPSPSKSSDGCGRCYQLLPKEPVPNGMLGDRRGRYARSITIPLMTVETPPPPVTGFFF